ncbi:MAG: transcriptional repressor [Acidipropionibacterium jensenii]|uniref:Fur family transcriptional regulator n=2 Tax=Acidipropionibacterium jensenii TaxID=1749 RepID=UPI0026474EF1|nr:Fur family transcriptional regulator [Acidipropionibacterium jensenii]MDN6481015.1 transcriptional repressor [Acidipropionibacterium jensenii]
MTTTSPLPSAPAPAVAGAAHGSPDWSDELRESGLRITSGRIAALEYLNEHPHSTVAEILRALRKQHPSLSTQSVGNIVRDLARYGMIRRIDLPDSGAARYETRVGDNHHHIQCIICGRIKDVDCEVGHAPCLTPTNTHGMRILEADVTFRGVCAECERKNPDFPALRTHAARRTALRRRPPLRG